MCEYQRKKTSRCQGGERVEFFPLDHFQGAGSCTEIFAFHSDKKFTPEGARTKKVCFYRYPPFPSPIRQVQFNF